jgi:hypothetical protein
MYPLMNVPFGTERKSIVFVRSSALLLSTTYLVKKKLRGFSPLANYTDRAIAAGQRS